MTKIMLSVQPKWCVLIAVGKKKIEVRTTVPNTLPCEVLMYQTKKKWIYKLLKKLGLYQGKVIGKFTIGHVDKLYHKQWVNQGSETYTTEDFGNNDILERACLDIVELCAYGKGKPLYAWHIDNLVIFDQPKELSEFGITKAPQSYQYIKGE